MGVPNNVIIGLVVVATMFTIASTVVSLTQLSGIENFFGIVTGAATDTASGDSNITITSATAIKNHNSSLGFGSGYVNSTCSFCEMTSFPTTVDHFSNGSNISRAAGVASNCCVSFTQPGSGFILENTGNTNISVGYTCGEKDGGAGGSDGGNCSFTHFIGGTRTADMYGLEIYVVSENQGDKLGTDSASDSVNSCAGGGSSYAGVTGWNITNNSAYGNAPTGEEGVGEQRFVPMSTIGHYLCGNATTFPLDSIGDRDAGIIELNITIPSSAASGAGIRAFVLTFNGTSE